MSQFDLPNAANIQEHELSNGIRVLVYENPHSEAVALKGSLRAGSVYEPFSLNGLASMTAGLLMSGTQARDFDALNGALENIGAELEFDTTKHRVGFNGRALAEDLPLLVDVLADALRYPVFPEEEVIEERTKRQTEINFGQQNTRYMASRTFREALYPNTHPFHYSTYGSLESLPRITAADIRSFHQTQYGADGMIIVLVGAVNADTALPIVEAAFGDWHNPQQAPVPTLPPVSPPNSIIRIDVDIPAKAQSDIVIGTLGPSRTDPHYRAATLANSILGEFGLMGRVGLKIREELGLAYYVYSRLEGGEGPGAWHINAGVAPENVELTIDKTRDEIHRLITAPVSEQDLDDNQAYFTGRLPIRLESNQGLVNQIHRMARYDLGLDYLMSYREAILRQTRADLLAAAQAYLDPDKLVIAVAG